MQHLSLKPAWNLLYGPTRPAAKPKLQPGKLSQLFKLHQPSNSRQAFSEHSRNVLHTLSLSHSLTSCCLFLVWFVVCQQSSTCHVCMNSFLNVFIYSTSHLCFWRMRTQEWSQEGNYVNIITTPLNVHFKRVSLYNM